jgi:hypothetical protein
MPDEVPGDLLERFVRGDQDAFESLFRQFEPRKSESRESSLRPPTEGT